MKLLNNAEAVARAVGSKQLPCECDVRFCHRITYGIVFFKNTHTGTDDFIAICELHYNAVMEVKRFPWENKVGKERVFIT